MVGSRKAELVQGKTARGRIFFKRTQKINLSAYQSCPLISPSPYQSLLSIAHSGASGGFLVIPVHERRDGDAMDDNGNGNSGQRQRGKAGGKFLGQTVIHGIGEVIERADAANAKPGDEQPTPGIELGRAEQS